MKIAVIGSGISGLSAAYFLARKHEVTLIEQDGRIGGHTNTIAINTPQGPGAVDTGWIVYNGINYPNLTALFQELEVATRPTSMSFAVSIGDGRYEWKGSDHMWTVFAQWTNLFKPGHIRMLLDILKLNKQCNALLKAGTLPSGSLGQFLDDQGFSQALRRDYLLPMAGMIWSCSPQAAAEYPADDFMRFFDSHSLFTATQQPTWHSVIGGSNTYVKRLMARYQGALSLNTPVLGIRRAPDDGVLLQLPGGEQRFDRVVCATHSDQALRLLTDASDAEREVLAGIPYSESRVVLHTDDSFLPKRRAAWASWNYSHPVSEIHDQRISGSYWMNLLQHIPGPVNYIVTLNPQRPVAAAKIIYDIVYHHPHYTAASKLTHAKLPAIQGRGGLWWAGAWTGYGFHEDGLKSGLRAVQGIDASCLPSWASGI
ncbi:FAD-dependent oxidoreductase [Nevskia sp.]|uniref:NAD(P)/FAD-dependent oxidoreductase n=1 Tax=Nevskia sp. TaxID=1929292 RepID=UPI0025DC695F|nr:FAD-dependent oxidoreductase [Nevskia sp.]